MEPVGCGSLPQPQGSLRIAKITLLLLLVERNFIHVLYTGRINVKVQMTQGDG